jgi:acrylyl-CoA reductase (NADPH)
MKTFQALVLDEKAGKPVPSFRDLTADALPPGDVLVSVAWSSLNYKDALAVTGRGKIVRQYPMVPGIDLAGTVEESSSPKFKKGDQVLVTGCGIGEETWGGYAQLARVKVEWVVPLPKGLSLKQAMAIGTAGFTAMLCVMALEDHGLKPGDGEVVVTGAAGGVGSVAVAVLSKLGHTVVASTGRKELEDYLKSLGAKRIVERSFFTLPADKPLGSQRWAGAVDTVGGETLASIIGSLAYGRSVAACGLAGGATLNTTVYPFILRAVNLLGINSSVCPYERRLKSWTRLAQELPLDLLDSMTTTAPMSKIPMLSEQILEGKIRGRTVIDINAR